MLEIIANLPTLAHISLATILGLLVGSFLNVVIFRYPKMLQHQWTAQSYEWLNKEAYTGTEPPTLSSPPSHCGHCKAPIRVWQNIPLVSWLLLGGKCANCKQTISVRYPLVELLTGALSAYVVFHFGWSLQSLLGLIFTWVLIVLTFIDFDHKLLPDDIVLPTLWLGLAISLIPIFANAQNALVGAIAGYLVFWIVFQVFKLLTGKEGMGHGDFKLMALLGAWLGWQFIPQIVLVSTLAGSIIGISLMVFKKASRDLAIPFGPYIAIAGWIALIWGRDINALYFSYL